MARIAEKSVKSKGWDWSKVSEDYWTKVSDEFLPVALRWKELGKKTVLDLGCGKGRHSLFLAKMGFDVTAIDLSPEGIGQLQIAAEKLKLDGKIKTLVCDMLELPFPANSFDAVLAFLSITHTDYAGLKKVISKVKSILKPAGRFYVTFNSRHSPPFANGSYEKIDGYTIIKTRGIEKGIPHTYLGHAGIVKLLSGFKILKLQEIFSYDGNFTSVHFFVEAEKKQLKL